MGIGANSSVRTRWKVIFPYPEKNTVVIVDDDDAVRDSLSVLLTLAGFIVRSCKSAAGLENVMTAGKVDCLVIDVHMPDMSGCELVEQLNSNGSSVPVILISGNIDAAIKGRAEKAGVTHFLEKPFSDHELINSIHQLVG